MQQYEMANAAIAQKARSERLYMHYALALAVTLALSGTALVILGIGDHLDIIVHGTGDLEARFINASPGVALWLVSAAVFRASKPRRLEATARHHDQTARGLADIKFSMGARDRAENEEQMAAALDPVMDDAKSAIQRLVADAVQQIEWATSAAVDFVRNERDRTQPRPTSVTSARSTIASGEGHVLYQGPRPGDEGKDGSS